MRCPSLKDLPPSPAGKTGWPWTEESDGRLSAVAEHDKYSAKAEGTRDEGRFWPKISIVTPNYNYEQFIEETIRSVLLQGYPNLEYIIIDGKSKDNSVEIIKKYEKWLTYWTSEKDRGQSEAINKGFSKATGEVFAWLNSDDMYYPGVLHKVAEHWAGHPDCHFLTGEGEFVNSRGGTREYYIKSADYSFKDLLRFHEGKYLPQPSVFFSGEAFRRLGGLDPDLFIAFDLDLWLRMRLGYRLCYLRGSLFARLRHHHEAKTWRSNVLAAEEARDVIKRYLRKTGLLEQFRIRKGLRFFYAKALCQKALSEYFNKNQNEAIKLLKKSISTHPAILILPIGLRLILRLILPASIKKRFFKVVAE